MGSGGSGGGGNPLSRVYESNGPDVKVRGTAQTVAEKYLQLGRDAQSSSDIVMAESYYQYAEHYLRIVAAAQAYQQQMQPQFRRPGEDGGQDEGDEVREGAAMEPRNVAQAAEQPDMETGGQPFESQRPAQQNYRSNRDYRDQQGGPQHNNRDRNNRPRWQDRRDHLQNANGEARPSSPQPRGDDQPSNMGSAAPLPGSEAAAETGQWEAPSFLTRPVPPVTSDAAETDTAPLRKPRERKPRQETEEPAAD
ncbi:MAG: DUF4167 domain-containing protein [Aestuariivirga sp.]